jgi:hypothetical protein
MVMVGSMLLVPTLAMGVAQQDPANPAAPGQQLQQDQAKAMPGGHEMTGVIAEVRDDSFSIRTDDQGVKWFMVTPEFKSSYASELVTGNRVTVWSSAGATADKMNATRIQRAEGTDTADVDIDSDVDVDVDRDIDADVDADNDSVTATVDSDREIDTNADLDVDTDNDTQIADTDSDLRDDDATYDTDTDSDELPRTATSLPEIGALGLLALLGAAVVSFVRKI